MRFGVDEAGKGPVIGSMFAAAVRAAPADLPDGVGDSKSLSADRRRTLALEIRERAAVGVSEVPVERIDDPETDMNALAVEAHVRALDQVARDGLSGTVDACDTDAARFGERVDSRVDADLSLDARHHADESDPLVGAASVVAKVERDAHVATLADRYGDLGSGYPSDARTRTFLREYVADHGRLPACARRSWATARDVLAAAEQSALEEF